MSVDLWLAVLHHLLFLGLIAMLVSEATLLRSVNVDVARLARIDLGYGLAALLVFAVGLARVFYGGKGWAFYQDNPWFWAKIATFVLIGLISILPTMKFTTWVKRRRHEPGWSPPASELRPVRRAVMVSMFLLAPLLGFAAAMARHAS